MRVNAKLLEAFVLVAEQRSFRRAAEKSSRSLSAISMQIRELEKQLEVVLFHRTTRRVELTAEGECLLLYANRAINELEEGLRLLKDVSKLNHGHIRVACVPSVACTRLPRVIVEFQRRHPAVHVEVHELLAKKIEETVLRQRVDFGIGPEAQQSSDLQRDSILVEPVCVVFPPGSPLRASRGISLHELAEMPILTVGRGTAQREELERAQTQLGIRLNITHEVAHAQTLLSMVAAGLGAAILPEMSLEVPGYKELHAYPIVIPPLLRELSVITLKGQALSPAVSRFVEVLKQEIRP